MQPDKKLRICFVTHHYGAVHNGPGRFANYFVSYLMRNGSGFDVTVISGDTGQARYGEKIVYVPRRGYTGSTLVSAWKVHRFLKREIGKGNVDALYYNAPNNAVLLPSGVPVFMNFNDYYNAVFSVRSAVRPGLHTLLYKLIWRHIEKMHCRKAELLFVNSRYTGRILSEAYGIPRAKFIVSYKAVDPARFKRKEPDAPDGIRIAFIGTDYRRKGLSDACRTVSILRKEYGRDCSFKILGKFGDKDIDAIRRILATSGISDVAEICTHGTDPGELLGQSDFLLHPAAEEAFGVVLLEALACGVIAVATGTGGIPEIINDGDNGFLRDADDYQGIADILNWLADDSVGRLKIVRRGYETVALFTPDRVCGRITAGLRGMGGESV